MLRSQAFAANNKTARTSRPAPYLLMAGLLGGVKERHCGGPHAGVIRGLRPPRHGRCRDSCFTLCFRWPHGSGRVHHNRPSKPQRMAVGAALRQSRWAMPAVRCGFAKRPCESKTHAGQRPRKNVAPWSRRSWLGGPCGAARDWHALPCCGRGEGQSGRGGLRRQRAADADVVIMGFEKAAGGTAAGALQHLEECVIGLQAACGGEAAAA